LGGALAGRDVFGESEGGGGSVILSQSPFNLQIFACIHLDKIQFNMKKTFFLLAFSLLAITISAQEVWNKKLPMSSIGASLGVGCSRIDGNNFIVSYDGKFLELDYEGNVSGLQNGSPINGNLLSTFLKKRLDPVSGNPFFLMGWRNSVNSPYSLAYYKPNDGGWHSFLTFGMGEVGNLGTPGPAVLELTDTSLLVFTKSFIRKIACPRDTLWIEWTKPITLAAFSFPNAAIEHNGVSVFVTTKGEVSAVNAEGFQIWLRTYDTFYFRGIAKLGADFVACGADSSGHAALVKLNSNGNLIWAKTFSEDLKFNAVTVAQDGNLVLTGKSVEGKIPLLKISQNGDLIWRKTYQTGIGATVLETLDGGYFLTGGGNQSWLNGIKTNALGETAAFDDLGLFRNRNLNNGGFSLTQSPSSSLFLADLNYKSGLQIPADSSTRTLSAHSPWLAGLDEVNNIHLSASTNGEVFDSDYKLGISSGSQKDFNRLWSIKRDEIAMIRRDFATDSDLDNLVPFDILTWPAKGNPNFRQNLDFTAVSTKPESFPAPFTDVNGDGIYNVYDGDYPNIKGDQMLFWIISDSSAINEPDRLPLGLDILISVFAFNCPLNLNVQQSIFADYQLINRSDQTYSETYFGFFSNPYLGCRDDDYFGSLPGVNSFYVYNQDAVDGIPGGNCSGGIATFGEKIPVQSITMLNHPLQHSIYVNRNGNSPVVTIDPVNPIEYYNYLQGKWRDGTLLTIGGNGYNPGNLGAVPTNFAFHDNPNDPQGWSMCAENLALGDRRMLNSHGPFTFAAGDTFSMQLAFTFHPDIPHPCPDIKGLVEPTIQQIQQWHDDGTLDAHLDLGSVLTLTPGQSLVLNATQPNPGTTYSWSTGQNTPVITVNQTGEYTVTVTPPTGCAYTETVLVKLATGTSSPTLPSWQVQPNPANEVLKIVFDEMEITTSALLRNAQGQLVATKSGRGNSLEISVSNLPSGLYWAELWQEGTFLGSRKVVVAR
jgi:hypothetical protein